MLKAIWPKPLGSLRILLYRACAVVLLLLLVLYMLTTTGISDPSNSTGTLHFWNMTTFLQDEDKDKYLEEAHPTTKRQRKLVLLWTTYFSLKNTWLPSTEQLKCPVSDCDATSDRSLLSNSSAVILHWRSIDENDLPPPCTPSDSGQCPLVALFNKESPPHTPKHILQTMEGRVHWTITYRKNSDIYAPYQMIGERLDPANTSIDFEPGKKLVCWLVSNCNTPSRREDFVKELKKYIKVDVYGQCGTASCPYAKREDCYSWLSRSYIFYLSLENSICKDYVTEKLYHALAVGMIPVVRGYIKNYSHLPLHSYIHANDFSSPEELAKYLVNVATNESLYHFHTQWRLKYEVKDYAFRWFCGLCSKLHNTSLDSVKLRLNLVSWWYDACS